MKSLLPRAILVFLAATTLTVSAGFWDTICCCCSIDDVKDETIGNRQPASSTPSRIQHRRQAPPAFSSLPVDDLATHEGFRLLPPYTTGQKPFGFPETESFRNT